MLEQLKPLFRIYLWNYVLIFNRHYNLCLFKVYTSPDFRQEIFWRKLNYSVSTHDNVLANKYLFYTRQLKINAGWYHCMVIFKSLFLQEICGGQNIIKGYFHLSVSQWILWSSLKAQITIQLCHIVFPISQNFIKGHSHLNIYQVIMV
jgi:hypothetical protein